MSDYNRADPKDFLESLKSSKLFDQNIFEKKPDLSQIRDASGQQSIAVFSEDKEKIVLIDLEVSDKDLDLKLDKEVAFSVVKKVEYNNTTTFSYLYNETMARELHVVIHADKNETQFLTLVLFRSDSVSRLLTTSTVNKSFSFQAVLLVEYSDPESVDDESGAQGLSGGAIGGIVGGVVVLIVILVIVSVCCCRKKKKQIVKKEPKKVRAYKPKANVKEQSKKTGDFGQKAYNEQPRK